MWRCDLNKPCVKFCESKNDKASCGMQYKNKRKNMEKEQIPSWRFWNDEKYPFYFSSLKFNELLRVFLYIADWIGMPRSRATTECFDFCQGKINKNSLTTIMFFSSVNKYKRFMKKSDDEITRELGNIIRPFLEKKRKGKRCLKF